MSITATRFATHIRTWLLIAALTGLLIAHIKNHDSLISSIAAMVARAISAIASVLQFSMLFRRL